jgi:hypothetical protein
MKGVSLAMETIVVIVIAVLVLVALIAFFLGVFPGAESQTQLVARQTNLCGIYIHDDPDCNSPSDVTNYEVKKELAEVCSELGYPCTENSLADAVCVSHCCKTFCTGEVVEYTCEKNSHQYCSDTPCSSSPGYPTYIWDGSGTCPQDKKYCCYSYY